MQHFFLLAADLTHVDAAGTVNTLFFAPAGCRTLISLTFPQSYRAVSLQQPSRGDVSQRQPGA
jgi:hypothetical protein